MQTPHFNFHIGAPRVAADLVKNLSASRPVRSDRQLRILKQEEYQNFLRHYVNTAQQTVEETKAKSDQSRDFWRDLSQHGTVAASQHAMMGHPQEVVRNGVLLPGAEHRIANLSALVGNCTVDLHLTLQSQDEYFAWLPSSNVQVITACQEQHMAVPSWFDLVSRLLDACPDRRIILWDFSEPDFIALPFAMTVFNLGEEKLERMKRLVRRYNSSKALIAKTVRPNPLQTHLRDMLKEQYQRDLENLGRLSNTILVRSNEVPSEFHI